jgi:hypothetical protein
VIRYAFVLSVLLASPALVQGLSVGRELELAGCDQFLENVGPDDQGTCHLPEPKLAMLKFKSRLHELSFFFGLYRPRIALL